MIRRTVVLLCLAAPPGAMACDPDPAALPLTPEQSGAPQAFLRPDPLRLSEPFGMELLVCDAGPVSRVEVDAHMPAHQHGMNYVPRVRVQADGQYIVSDMVFHMPGHWRVTVAVHGATATHHYAADLYAE